MLTYSFLLMLDLSWGTGGIAAVTTELLLSESLASPGPPGGEGEEEPAEPDLAACVLLVVLCTAVFLQHQVGLILQNLHLQGVTQPADIWVEENDSLETGELCVVQTKLGYPGDGLAELRLLGVAEANLPLREGEDDEVGPAVLQQHHLVAARQLLERGDGLGPLDAHKQQLEVVQSGVWSSARYYCIVG